MLVKFLGILDLMTAIILFFFVMLTLSSFSGVILLLGFILLMKGILFSLRFNIVSILDIIISFIIIYASSNPLPLFVAVIVSLYLIQKGIFSLVA